MSVRAASGVIRCVFAAVCLVALVARFLWGLSSATFNAANFFAYLTMQSNMAFVVVSAVAGIVAFRVPNDPRWLTNARALVLSWTLVAGIVFALLIQQAGLRDFRIDVPWSDQVLHFWLPALSLVEWLVVAGRGRAQWRFIPFVVGYPVVWGILTLVRGAAVGWYPYFFLDPDQVRDPVEFAFYSGFALVVFAIVGSAVVALSRVPPPHVRGISSRRARVLRATVR